MVHASAPAVWPAAVSPLVADALQAPERPARVLAAFPAALYLQVDRHDLVVPVLASDALRLPTGLRLALRSTDLAWRAEPGTDVVVGCGRVRLPGRDVVGVRSWRPSRVASPPAPLGLLPLGRSLGALQPSTAGALLRELAADLTAAAVAAANRPAAANRLSLLVAGLLGAGQGLTPSGDDALCGVMLALRASGGQTAALAAVTSAVGRLLPATTSLSASLLRAASDGYAVPEVAALANAVAHHDETAIGEALPAVLSIGHSSGADLLAGFAGTLDALTRTTHHPEPEGARRA